jgi:hypothetical protein
VQVLPTQLRSAAAVLVRPAGSQWVQVQTVLRQVLRVVILQQFLVLAVAAAADYRIHFQMVALVARAAAREISVRALTQQARSVLARQTRVLRVAYQLQAPARRAAVAVQVQSETPHPRALRAALVVQAFR